MRGSASDFLGGGVSGIRGTIPFQNPVHTTDEVRISLLAVFVAFVLHHLGYESITVAWV